MLISLKVAKLGLNLGIGQARMRFIAHLASCLKECARYVEIEGLLLNIDVSVHFSYHPPPAQSFTLIFLRSAHQDALHTLQLLFCAFQKHAK
jgi:hypothetical protein